MAKKYSFMAVIGADTSGFAEAVKQIDGNSRSLKRELSEINKGLKLDPENAELLALKMEALENAAKNAADKVKELADQEQAIKDAHASGALSDEQYREYERALASARAEAENFSSQARELGNSLNGSGEEARSFGNIISEAFGKDSLRESLEKIKSAAKEVIDVFKAIGSEIQSIVTETAAMGDDIDKNSQRLGMSRTAYQEWGYILSQNGTDISVLQTSLRSLTNAIDSGSDAFGKLGLSAEKMRGMTGEEQFTAVVTALQSMDDETERNIVANDLLGRSYQQLIPLLNQDAGSVEILRQRAHDTNQILGNEGVNAAVNYTDAMDTLTRSVTGFKNDFGAEILPGITLVINGITDLISGIDGGEEKIKEGVDSFFDGLENALPKVEDLLGTLSDAMGEKAPEIVAAAALKITEGLPKIANAVGGMLPVILQAVNGILPSVGEAGGAVVTAITNGILGLLASPDTLADTLNAFVLMGGNFCQSIADGVMHYDWGGFSSNLMTGLAGALDKAQRTVSVWMDNIFSGGELYGGNIDNVAASDFIDNMLEGADIVADTIEGVSEYAARKYDEGKAVLDETFYTTDSGSGDKDSLTNTVETVAEDVSAGAGLLDTAVGEVLDTASAAEDAEKQLEDQIDSVYRSLETEQLQNGYDDSWLLEHKRAFLETLDHNSETYKEYNLKLLEEQRKFDDSQKEEKESAAKEEFDVLLESLENEEITREEFNRRYAELAEKWSEDQIDISEYTADKIADYDEKTRKEQLDAWEKSSKEITDKVTKAYEDVKNSFESAKKELSTGLIDEKVTDENGKDRYIFTDYKQKIKDLQKYQEDLQKLRDMGLSEQHMEQIMSLDYDSGERQGYINELLGMNSGQREKYLRDIENYYAELDKTAAAEIQDDINEADKTARNAVSEIYGSMPEDAYQSGTDTAKSYLQGIIDEMNSAAPMRFAGADVSIAAANKQAFSGAMSADSGKFQSLMESQRSMLQAMPAGNWLNVKTPINISIAGEKAISTTLEKLLSKNTLTGGNNLHV